MTSLLSLAFLATCQAPPQESAFRYPLHETTLENGLRILIVERRDVPRVYGSLWWRVGSVHERPGVTGLSHFFEHMMFMGTKTIGTTDPAEDARLNAAIEAVMEKIRALKLQRLETARRGGDPAEADARIETLRKAYESLVEEQKKITIPEHLSKIFQANGGTGLNATTSFDRTNYYVELPSNKIELFCWLESDRFLRPVFRSFYPEREVVKEERRMRTDSTPTGLIHEAYWSMFWQAHPYTWPVIGWMSDIDQYTLTDAEAYYRTHYSPENCTLVFVGDVDVPALQDLCRRYFGRLKRSSSPRDPVVTIEPPQVAERRLHAEADAQDEINVRWHGPSGVHKDSAALDLLMGVLSGRSGRLYRPLVEEKRLALETEAWYWSLRHGGVIHVGATPREGADPAALERELLAIVEEVREKGITERELLKARNQQLADLLRGMRTNAGIAQQLGYFETIGSYKDLFAYLKALETATPDDVRRVARDYLKPEGRNVLVLRRRAAK